MGEEAKLVKVRLQVDALLGEGKLYEAQQLYQSLYYRYSGRKKFAIALALLQEGTMKLLSHEKFTAAGELALLMVDCLEKEAVGPDAERIDKIMQIVEGFRQANDRASDDSASDDTSKMGEKFLRAAIKWSQHDADPQGSSTLHLALGRLLLSQGSYAKAQRHYLRADTISEHVTMVLQWSEHGYASERDMFLARCVLEYLCLEDMRHANLFLTSFKERSEAMETPLVHFIEFLLKTCERSAAPLFQLLRQKYEVSINRDAVFTKYLDRIGEIYFDIRAPKGLLAGLFSM